MRTSGNVHLGSPLPLGKSPRGSAGQWEISPAGLRPPGGTVPQLLPAARGRGLGAGRGELREPLAPARLIRPGSPGLCGAAAPPAPARLLSRVAGGSRGLVLTRGSPLILNFNPLVMEPECEKGLVPFRVDLNSAGED